MLNAEQDIKKWGAVLEHGSAAPIQDNCFNFGEDSSNQ